MRKLVGAVVLAAAVLAGSAGAQERPAEGKRDIVGTVADDAGRPLVGAFVALDGAEWGFLTSETGRFALRDAPLGQVTLTVELIGYETLVWSGDVPEGRALALTMAPKPILLEGLTVVADRLKWRRRSTAVSVRALDRDALATAAQSNALDFIVARGGVMRVLCREAWGNECVLSRGRAVEPSVWVDEVPFFGGLEYLRAIQPSELYLVEVYGGGRHIRAYTNRFMEHAAQRRLWPVALLF